MAFPRGQQHPKARPTTEEVRWMRALREIYGLKVRVIAEKMELPYRTVQAICLRARRIYE